MELKTIKIPFKIKKPILAMGSQTKNTICFVKDDKAFMSRVHSDLSNPGDILSFEKDTKYFLKKGPKIIAYDLHPDYQSTRYALELSPITYRLSPIQHHHAHIASCMAENGLENQKVIGVGFDGTGLGTDGTLWGAEFLVCDYKNFNRVAHLKQIPLLGGERAILEPSRLTAAWLYAVYKDKFLNMELDLIKSVKKNWPVLKKMLLSGFSSPSASSMGRLFDAAASLVLAKYKANFEADLAIELEKVASNYNSTAINYKFKIIKNKDNYILDPALTFRGIIKDLKGKEPKEKIAYRFHLTVAEMINRMCLRLRKSTGITNVVLSGGVFQNKLLLRLSLDLLYKQDFRVFTHKILACNDSSISLGQALIASFARTNL